MINGFFDLSERLEWLSRSGDTLVRLKQIIPWESFREPIGRCFREHSKRKSNAGRKAFDGVLMFKILILESLYNLSDDAVEYQIADRISFMRFLDLSLDSRIPDAKTIWAFRDVLTKQNLAQELFTLFDRYLRAAGFTAQDGQIIDASIVRVPVQRNTREENAQIKAGTPPLDSWSAPKRSQKDVEARWTKKYSTQFYGYKNHIQVDVKHKFIRSSICTPANIHDGDVFEELLDSANTGKFVYADSAYDSKANRDMLQRHGLVARIVKRACRYRHLEESEQLTNRSFSRIRCRIEHVFGVMRKKLSDVTLRAVGLARCQTVLTLRNLAYNFTRYSLLTR